MMRHTRILSGVLVLLATSASFALAAPPKLKPARGRSLRPADMRAVVKKWHEVTPGRVAPTDENHRPKLVLVSINTGERVELAASSDEGGFDAHALDVAAHLLRDDRASLEHPIEPATLDLVYRAQRKFDAQEIRVISGYRAPRSRFRNIHAKGRAIDLVVPGTDDKDVATWARAQGFAGVGVYPRSGYCHLDTRPDGYSWIDTSGPGQYSREYPVHRDESRQGDHDARKAGRRGVPPFVLPSSSVTKIWSEGSSSEAHGDDAHESGDDTGDTSDE
ncbi:MAG: DUF882 domain-containing protein [Polyangiaceae bacterium]